VLTSSKSVTNAGYARNGAVSLCGRGTTTYRGTLLLDLDRFRQVNDSLGHDVGDRLLQAVASRLTSVDIGDGTVARIGADEFALLAHVPGTTSGDDLAERAMRALRGPVRLDGMLVDLTASAGLATRAARSGDDFETVIRHADLAMHDAKRHGDAIAGYEHRTDRDSPAQFQLLADFRQALVNEDTAQISMHYQPQVSLTTGAVDGLEALLRRTHPVYGFINTTAILGVAEHTAVMQLLSAHVIDRVTAQLAAWRREGRTPRVAVTSALATCTARTSPRVCATASTSTTFHPMRCR
jgi:diguanylate cyclase (GGDEF)-like protein